MADELEKLRPEVREAVGCVDSCFTIKLPYRETFMDDSWQTVRAELLRLADECAMIPRAQLLANLAAANERAEKAEAELATAQNTINAQQGTMGAMKRKLALSEGELAALKARVANSPIASLVYGQGDLLAVISAENPDDWAGKLVRLVEVE